MLNEPRTYRQSPFQIGLVILVFVMLGGFLLLNTMGQTDYLILILLAGIFGIVFLSVIYSMTKKIIVSDDEISTQTILGAKSLRWSEISRVSGRGYAIKLHNFDGDVTVAPSPQLPGYEEVVDWIGTKRPDLFNPLEYSEMKRSMPALALLVALMIVLIGVAVAAFGLLYFSKPETSVNLFMPLLFIVIIFIVFFVTTLSTPQSVTLDGKSLCLKYLLGERTLLADEISSIELRFTQTRNGKNYFVALNLINKKVIRISGLNPNLPVVYLVLKNWQKKNAQIKIG
jgi:hypothetical protein